MAETGFWNGKVVPASARQAIAWTAGKDFCKTNAQICIKNVYWSDSTIGSALKQQRVYTFTKEQTLLLETHTQMYKAEMAEQGSDQLKLPVKCDAALLS